MQVAPGVHPPVQKGKGKLLKSYVFNEEGLLSPDAIKIIDNGALTPISKEFGKTIINLDKELYEGIYARDVLESGLLGNLDYMLAAAKKRKKDQGALKIAEPSLSQDGCSCPPRPGPHGL
ncbi:hypothetical protein POM88_044049 [Heracleum sosnowskyi]|uniref:Uncharacterized protein n=1 Tax=Heracleum sosnowskyi TaxID=360622 RepID=A0AAD8H4N1_9APIA|nr:hypothetical protein POM88_044049 [Heracleum sosnowskyi]